MALALAANLACAMRGHAQTALVTDADASAVSGPSCEPAALARVGGRAIFHADDGIHGQEPWITDGVTASLLLDIAPGPAGSGPTWLFESVSEDLVAFSAWEPCAGRELWVSDGTPEGTRRFADIRPGPEGSDPSGVVSWNGALLFGADDGVHGRELWASDGTPEGTRLVRDIVPGAEGSNPGEAVMIDNGVFFLARPSYEGLEAWHTDGSAQGTWQLLPRCERWNTPAGPTEFHGKALFEYYGDDAAAWSEAWISDGTLSGTFPLIDAGTGARAERPMWIGGIGSMFAFQPQSPAAPGPWVTDGTRSGTRALLAPDANPAWTWDFGMGVADDRLWVLGGVQSLMGYFQPSIFTTDGTIAGTRILAVPEGGFWSGAMQGDHALVVSSAGDALWRVDAAGMTQLASLSSCWPEMVDVNGRMVTFADAAGTGLEPWSSDGTPAGTRAMADIRRGSATADARPENLVALGERLIWTTRSPAGELRAAGSSGAVLLRGSEDQPPRFASGSCRFGERLIFASGGRAWITDGTDAGTRRLGDVNVGPFGSNRPPSFVVFGDRVWFGGSTSASGTELWATDGTPEGTVLVAEVRPGRLGSQPHAFVATSDRLWFLANDGVTGDEPWVTDGTPQGTHLVADLRPGSGSSDARDLVTAGGRLFFVADDGHGADTWATDRAGTAAQRVLDVADATYPAYPALTPLGDHVIVFVRDGVRGLEPWRSDGSPAGTSLVADLCPGTCGTFPIDLVVAGDRLFFGAWGSDLGPYVSDGTPAGTRDILDGSQRRLDGAAEHFVPLGDGACFLVDDDGSIEPDLWCTDGTEAGTRVVLEDATPLPSEPATPLTAIDGRLLFARSTQLGVEPWVSDGTPEGTHALADVHPGSGSSDPADFVAAGARVYFTADDGRTGREVHWFPRAMLSDFDLDGVPDAIDRCSSAIVVADLDADGIRDPCDNCERVANPSQEDADCDGVGDACAFAWGDVAPASRPDGTLDIGDVVRMLRMVVGLDRPTEDELVRGDVAPCSVIDQGPPAMILPSPSATHHLAVADVVIALRASVGLVVILPPS